VPPSLAGRTIGGSAIRSETDCTVIAVDLGSRRVVNPSRDMLLSEGTEMVLIGTLEAEEKFIKRFAQPET
jgi:voltage-gated potassium channel